MELKDYLRILRQRKLLIGLTALIAIALGTVLTLAATPQYQSSVRLFVSTSSADGQDAYQGGLFSEQRVKSYANLITGEEISRRVVTKLKLNETPRELSSRIKATVQPDTVVLSISVTDKSAKAAKQLSQAVAEAFVSYVAELETPPGKSTAPVKASIVDSATTPGAPVSPRPVRNLTLALLLGLMVGAASAVLRDTLDNRIKSSEMLAGATKDAPVLGNIHYDKTAIKTPLISSLSSHAPRVESFRVLRTNLQFVNVDSSSKVFVITSAVPGEGKSTTACNLAITISETHQRVLLIEADLRRPKATAYFQLENTVGVTTVLVGKLGLSDAIQQFSPNCDLLASGSTPPNPAELLQSAGMKRLLDEARKDYDVVLIDAPPLLPVTDAAILASEADGAILVVHHGSTTRDQVEACVSRIESVDGRLVGTIVNMSPAPRKGRSGYGYGYGYGYAPVVGRAKADDGRRAKSKDAKENKARKKKSTAEHSQTDFQIESNLPDAQDPFIEEAANPAPEVEHVGPDSLPQEHLDAENLDPWGPLPGKDSRRAAYPDVQAAQANVRHREDRDARSANSRGPEHSGRGGRQDDELDQESHAQDTDSDPVDKSRGSRRERRS